MTYLKVYVTGTKTVSNFFSSHAKRSSGVKKVVRDPKVVKV